MIGRYIRPHAPLQDKTRPSARVLQMEEHDFGAPAQPAAAAKAKAKAKAKASGEKKSGGGGGSRPAKLPCLCCPELRHANTRFCKTHKRGFDSMAYQAKKSPVEGAEEAFQKAMQDDFTAKSEVLKFCELNPPDQRYARKQFIDWAQFKQTHGQRTEVTDRSKCKPMWEGEFLLWAKNVKALPQAEAEHWWKEYLNNPRIERDNDGYKGRQRLWIPAGESKLTDKSKFSESVAEQGNKSLKEPSAEDVQMLKDHVLRQQQSIADPFFTSQNRTASAPTSKDPPQVSCEAEEPPAKKAKIDVDRQGPKLVKTMEKDMKAIQKCFVLATEKYQLAKSKLQQFPREMFVDDLALMGLLRSLDLRLHFLERWKNDTSETTEASVVGLVDGVLTATQLPTGDACDNLKANLSKSAREALDAGSADFAAMKPMPASRLLKDYQPRLPFKETDNFLDEGKMRLKMDQALQLQRVEEYEALKAEWQVLSASASSIATSISKVSGDVSEHLDTKVRETKRQQARNAAAEKTKALKAIREQAKQAAEEIKAKPKNTAAHPVFSLDADMAEKAFEAVPVLEGTEKIQSWSTPWVVNNWKEGKECLTETSLKKSLDTFAAQYKKLGDSGGRHQYLLQAGAVKTMVDKLLLSAMPAAHSMLDLEAEDIEGGGKFMAATWLYGFNPGMNYVGLTPNAAAQVRVHAKGEVQLMLFHWQDFSEKMKLAGEAFSKALDHVSKLTDEKLEDLKANGVKMWKHTLTENELIFVPAGFVSVEACDLTCTEVYGIRKSFFPTTDQSVVDSYRNVLTQFAKDKRSIGQMEAVAASLERALKKA